MLVKVATFVKESGEEVPLDVQLEELKYEAYSGSTTTVKNSSISAASS